MAFTEPRISTRVLGGILVLSMIFCTWLASEPGLYCRVFAEQAENNIAFYLGQPRIAKRFQHRIRAHARIHCFPIVAHHVARVVAAGKKKGEKRIDPPEVE